MFIKSDGSNSQVKTISIFIVAIIITVVHLTVIRLFFAAPFNQLLIALIQQNGHWYASIVDYGYRANNSEVLIPNIITSNAAFFPGYPVLARILKQIIGIDTQTALVLTSLLSCVLLWVLIIKINLAVQVPVRVIILVVICIMTHPMAFYFLSAYSESLFMACILCYIYSASVDDRLTLLLSLAFGFAMTATRAFGLLVVIYPVIRYIGLNKRTWFAGLSRPIIIMTFSSLGAVSFFIFCAFKFGKWNTYFELQTNWGINPDFLFPLNPKTYDLIPDDYSHLLWTNKIVTIGTTLGLIAIVIIEYIINNFESKDFINRRLYYYVIAFLLTYFPAAAVANIRMLSMIRYSLISHVLIIVAGGGLLKEIKNKFPSCGLFCEFLSYINAAVMVYIQMIYFKEYSQGKWIA